jgi:Trk K+ transport system NAD-binding subunit
MNDLMQCAGIDPPLENHVVICNCNEKVRAIVEEIHMDVSGKPYDIVLLIQDQALWQNHPDWHPRETDRARFITVYGSPFDREVLRTACIEKAKAAIILADPNHGQLADAQSTLMAVAIEKQNPQVHTIQELILSTNRDHLKAMNVDEVICLGEISEKLIAQSCISPGVKNIFESLLTTGRGTPQIFLQTLGPDVAGISFRKIARACIESKAPFIAVGYVISLPDFLLDSDNINEIRSILVINPKKQAKDLVLSEYDKLILIGYEQPVSLEVYVGMAHIG